MELGIEGLFVETPCVTRGQEEELVSMIETNYLADPKPGVHGISHVQGFMPQEGGPEVTPDVIYDLREHVAPRMGMPDSVIASRYNEGAWLPFHADPFVWSDTICVLNLLADSTLTMLYPPTGERRDLHVPRRSLVIMGGNARAIWQHGIEKVESPRIAVVLRKLALH